jgi:hypothetical protein
MDANPLKIHHLASPSDAGTVRSVHVQIQQNSPSSLNISSRHGMLLEEGRGERKRWQVESLLLALRRVVASVGPVHEGRRVRIVDFCCG